MDGTSTIRWESQYLTCITQVYGIANWCLYIIWDIKTDKLTYYGNTWIIIQLEFK
jgi:hypothetical protein